MVHLLFLVIVFNFLLYFSLYFEIVYIQFVRQYKELDFSPKVVVYYKVSNTMCFCSLSPSFPTKQNSPTWPSCTYPIKRSTLIEHYHSHFTNSPTISLFLSGPGYFAEAQATHSCQVSAIFFELFPTLSLCLLSLSVLKNIIL